MENWIAENVQEEKRKINVTVGRLIPAGYGNKF